MKDYNEDVRFNVSHAPLVQPDEIRRKMGVFETDYKVVGFTNTLENVRKNNAKKDRGFVLDMKKFVAASFMSAALAIGGAKALSSMMDNNSEVYGTSTIEEVNYDRPNFDEIYSGDKLLFEAPIVDPDDGSHYRVVVTNDGEYLFIGSEGPFTNLHGLEARDAALDAGFDDSILLGKHR